MILNTLIQKFVEDFQCPTTLKETKNKNLLGHSEPFIELNEYMKEHSAETQEYILKIIASQLIHMDIYKACCCTFFCGCIIGKSKPGEAGLQIVDFFTKIIEQACHVVKISFDKYPDEKILDELFVSNPDAVRAFRGLPPLTLAIMDTLAKSAKSREHLRLQNIYNKLEKIAPFVDNGQYLLRMYPVCGSIDLLVLAPEQKNGMIVQVCDVATNFHLLTLLERAIYQGELGERFGLTADFANSENQQIFAYASGEVDAHENLSVLAHASYTSIDGIMLWGEMPPYSIPSFRGMPVIMIHPEQYNRSWDLFFAVRCHPYLLPDVKIQKILSLEEVTEWLSIIDNSICPAEISK